MYKIWWEVDTENKKVKVDVIKDYITDLKKDIENMGKHDVDKIKKINEIMDLAELFLYFNNEDQEGSGLRILTPSEMLSRLPISLGQLKAGNNSKKLKNEIRQLLYSLYRSKKINQKNI